jgi:hypothetical protein
MKGMKNINYKISTSGRIFSLLEVFKDTAFKPFMGTGLLIRLNLNIADRIRLPIKDQLKNELKYDKT